MRLALLGAFAFPAPQGSQRFFLEQARALQAAGAEVVVHCYGSGDGRPVPDLELVRVDAAISPARIRAGFDPKKPRADRALVTNLLASHRDRQVDAVLSHNAEATFVALEARRRGGPPVVSVAHTLWRGELESYLPGALAVPARAAGWAIDALGARLSNATIVLSRVAESALRRSARRIERIAPGFHAEPVPDAEAVDEACRRHGLEREGFVVYAGNLDAYQDLPLLDAAAARGLPYPVVVVTHDARGPALPHLRVVEVEQPETARRLQYGARVAVLPRRVCGGFPIKLLAYLEAARPVLAFAGVADTLVHDESAWLLPAGAGADELAEGLRTLCGSTTLADRLGRAGRAVLFREHAWSDRALETLAVAREAAAPS